MNEIFKPMWAVLGSFVCAVTQTVVPMFILTMCFVIADVITAYRLQMRLVKAGKIGASEVRFSSYRLGRVFVTLSKILGLLVLSAMVDYLVLEPFGLNSVRFVAGGICFWQSLSLLENEAAENDAPWAVYARKFIVDKAKRYLGNKTD